MSRLKIISKKLWKCAREIFLELFGWLALLAFLAYLLGGCDGGIGKCINVLVVIVDSTLVFL
ncbi:hypothetical protein [Wohlfahrtiimonas larvae]|uniref:hypothetical protein n=1 Tax=Wohlfahrtiimonas larvae TaxID=1157986 RepID=UPI00098D57B2|nr:hypothetical protein [Wohlfahrtiimonas larvae]